MAGATKRPLPWLTRNRWILFPVTVVCFLFFAFVDFDFHHDGVMLKPAMDVANGLVVFRDTFSQYGILTPLFQGLLVWLFGAEILVLRLATVLVYGLCAVELDRLWSRFLRPAFRWLVFGLFLGLPSFYFYIWDFHSWPSVYALYCMLLAGNFLLNYFDRNRLWLLFACGVATAAAFGFRQPCGLVTILAVAMTLGAAIWSRRYSWRDSLQALGAYAGGLAALLGVFACYLTIYSAWGDYIRQCWIYAADFGWSRGGSGHFKTMFFTFFPIETAFVLFPLVSLGWFFYAAWLLFRRRKVNRCLPLLGALLIGLASYHQYYPVGCPHHWYWSAIPMFGAFALLLQRIFFCRKLCPVIRWGLTILLLAWPLWAIGQRLGGIMETIRKFPQHETVALPGLKGLYLSPARATAMNDFIRALEQIPPELRNRYYLNLTKHAIFSAFFPEQENIHPMYVNWQNYVYPDYSETIKNFVNENSPIIISFYPNAVSGYRPVGHFYLLEPTPYYVLIPPI